MQTIIKVDEKGNFNITELNLFGNDRVVAFFTFEEIERAYLLAKSKREIQNKPIKYGCHVNVDQVDEVIDNCVFDDDTVTDCTFACYLQEQRKGKFSCQYWRPIEVNK